MPVQTAAGSTSVRHVAPANPSNGQIANAAAVKAQAAVDVGRLSGLITGVDVKIQDLNDAAELAKENYLEALSKLSTATTSATEAQTAVITAAGRVDAARSRFRLSVASSYMNRTPDAGSLLTAPNPSALLERDQLYGYAQGRQSSAIDDLYRATVGKANADATARTAVATQTIASANADTAAKAAVIAVSAAKTQRVGLAARKTSYQTQLQSAGERLTGLKNKRAAFLAWQQAEARRKAIEAARLAAQRRRELAAQAREAKRLEALARQRAADQRAAQAAQAAQARKDAARQQREGAAAAAASASAASASASSASAASASASSASAAASQHASNNSSSGSAPSNGSSSSGSDSSGAGSTNPTAAPASKRRSTPTQSRSPSSTSNSSPSNSSTATSDNSGSSTSGSQSGSGGSSDSGSFSGTGGGSWSPARGRAAARRAEAKVGVQYSYAAGSYTGATLGVCIPGDSAWNDCHIRGYDCSGLALYAWAGEGVYMAHYSQAQYNEGSVHPSIDTLMPGDLVFFSSNGQQSGIHHVAIYIGNDQVVQAPQSGDLVKISNLWRNGYFGATRPGT